tara:strand:+ start:240 stop:578 length:339 start_codon:yes stop_codon:yes gene_type:complete
MTALETNETPRTEVIEREVVKLNNVELVQFEYEKDGSTATFSVDPHELYWKLCEWEETISGLPLLTNLKGAMGVELSNTHLSQIYHEIIRIAESREDAIRKKLEASRKEIAS